MDDTDVTTPYALTATAALDLVTTRTLVEAMALIGIEWSPVPFDRLMPTSEEGLYSWVIGRGHEHVDPLDRPVAYIGVGTDDEGLRGRLRNERSWIDEFAAHAHGRAMFRSRLNGTSLGGPVREKVGADISCIEETIRASGFKNSGRGIQKLQAWLSGRAPDVVHKAEQLCIRAAVHIGDSPPPLNSQHATAWASDAPCDWGAGQ
jgi:hypothetical protein